MPRAEELKDRIVQAIPRGIVGPWKSAQHCPTLLTLAGIRIAERTRGVEISGIRKVFDLAANLKDPVNLSIGQPHFPVPAPIKKGDRVGKLVVTTSTG